MIEGRKTIAVCTSRIYDAQMFSFIKLFNEELVQKDYRLLVFTLNTDLYWDEDGEYPETAVFKILPYSDVEAIVIMDEKIKSHRVATSIIEKAKEFDTPVFVVDGTYEGTVSIRFDYAAGFEKIARHVIEDHHCKRPHMMAGFEGNTFSEERIEVFKKVLKDNNIPFTDNMLSYGDFWATPARKATEAILARGGELPDAIICANDFMAINVCDVLTTRGIRVPEDIIVTGFDGIEETTLCSPRVSTVKCDVSHIASSAALSIMEYLNENKTDNITVIPEMATNESCGCNSASGATANVVNRVNDSIYRYQDDLRVLQNTTINMQLSTSKEELYELLKNCVLVTDEYLISDLCVMVETGCFDPSGEILDMSGSVTRDKVDFVSLCDSYATDDGIKGLDGHILVPHIKELFELKMPLIFNAMSYMGRPLGYICYFNPNFDNVAYSKINNVTNSLSMGLGGYITMRRQQYLADKLAELYKLDTLTGFYNRAGFKDTFAKMCKENEGKSMTTIMTDLDKLKYINDTFGHEEGDRAIKAVADAFRYACPDDALLLRFGGDEMIAFVPGTCDSDAITKKAAEYLTDFNERENLPYPVSASYGSNTVILSEESDLEETIKNADIRMYSEKRSKNNPI